MPNRPAGHKVHTFVPFPSAYRPAGHGLHFLALGALKNPLEHTPEQNWVAKPGFAPYCPAAHAKHRGLCSTPYIPMGQAWHATAAFFQYHCGHLASVAVV